ncbi:MAG TPA: Mur ligase domain-containing protein [Patescibacteria group bacterium]|nr:Mur ligase domain-containing protein [Patescibacteria group bacterium]
MHVYFSGIGGTAIGPLALIAQEAGYEVSGSDKQDSQYIQYLKQHGLKNIHIGQTYEQIRLAHEANPIDWYVYSSAVAIENPDAPELGFCKENGIRTSKRDELLNKILVDQRLKLVAIAGTHGKTTTTAMAVWLFKQLEIPVSYSVGAKISFGDMGQFVPGSEYFVYEADEFDRNFLAFHPYMSLISGVDWDHHEIFPTQQSYWDAFKEFLTSSEHAVVWRGDAVRLQLPDLDTRLVLSEDDLTMEKLGLLGIVNRRDAWLVIQALHKLTGTPVKELMGHMDRFPGLNRRFERVSHNLYSDYAHTIEKVKGALQTAHEASENVVVVYEPLTNRRQHFIKEAYKDLFHGVKKLYWVPSYLAREDPDQPVLSPAELIEYMDNKEIAEPAELNQALKLHIQEHIKSGDLVICMSGGGGGSLDEWLRQEFK